MTCVGMGSWACGQSITTPDPVLLCRDSQWWAKPPREEQGCVFQPTNGKGMTSGQIPASSKHYMAHTPPTAQSPNSSHRRWTVGTGKSFLWNFESSDQRSGIFAPFIHQKPSLTFAAKTPSRRPNPSGPARLLCLLLLPHHATLGRETHHLRRVVLLHTLLLQDSKVAKNC